MPGAPKESRSSLTTCSENPAQSELPYFLGSIVLARRDDGGDEAPDLVLDGQQRLTTVSLLISALIDRLKREGSSDADENKMYLFSKRVQGEKTPKIFLQAEDSKVFEQLIADPARASEPKLQTTRLGLAVTKIFELLGRIFSKPAIQGCLKAIRRDVWSPSVSGRVGMHHGSERAGCVSTVRNIE